MSDAPSLEFEWLPFIITKILPFLGVISLGWQIRTHMAHKKVARLKYFETFFFDKLITPHILEPCINAVVTYCHDILELTNTDERAKCFAHFQTSLFAVHSHLTVVKPLSKKNFDLALAICDDLENTASLCLQNDVSTLYGNKNLQGYCDGIYVLLSRFLACVASISNEMREEHLVKVAKGAK